MADYNPTGRTRAERDELHSNTLRDRYLEVAKKPVPKILKPGVESPAALDLKFEMDLADVVEQLEALLLSKHKDYGPKNISQSPGGPLNGLRVRMWDKLARINNLIESGARPKHESLQDSFKDMANYAIIGLLVLEGKWPKE